MREADPARQLVQRLGDAAHVLGLDMLEAVPQQHPIDGGGRWSWRAGAAIPDQLGIEAGPLDLVGLGIDFADQVEIDEAVVERRDQGVGAEHRFAGEGIVAAGGVDDDDVGILGKAGPACPCRSSFLVGSNVS